MSSLLLVILDVLVAEAFERFLKLSCRDINETDATGNTALILASRAGKLQKVHLERSVLRRNILLQVGLLLEAKADVNTIGPSGIALHVCARKTNYEVTR